MLDCDSSGRAYQRAAVNNDINAVSTDLRGLRSPSGLGLATLKEGSRGFICKKTDIAYSRNSASSSQESEANQFISSLLLPSCFVHKIFEGGPSFDIQTVAEEFDASLTAAGLNIVKISSLDNAKTSTIAGALNYSGKPSHQTNLARSGPPRYLD